MTKAEGIIFDMDGTLYPLSANGTPWPDTTFGKTVLSNVELFIGNEFGLDQTGSIAFLDDLKSRFKNEISAGLEAEHGIPRRRFFEATWNVDTKDIVAPQSGLADMLGGVATRRALLSAAPQIWIDRVLDTLGVADSFNGTIFNGETDILKPLPAAFQQIIDLWGISADKIISIGDQEHTDIVPARQLGMTTVRISPVAVHSVADIVAPNLTVAIEQLKTKGLV